MELLSNAETWYTSLELLLRPLLHQYKVPDIHSMTEFFSAVHCCLDGAAKEQKLRKEVANERQATTDATTRATAAAANVKVLDADLFKQRTDVSRQTTELSTANARIAEFERDIQKATTKLTTARIAEREESTAVFDIQPAWWCSW